MARMSEVKQSNVKRWLASGIEVLFLPFSTKVLTDGQFHVNGDNEAPQ